MFPAESTVHANLHRRACTVLQFNGPTNSLGTEPGSLMPAKRKAPAKPAPAPESPAPYKSSSATGMTIPEEKAQAIAAAHLAGVPITRICKELQVGFHTVAALIRNRPDLLGAARDVTAANWRTLAALGTAELVERLPEMKDHALTVMAAVATEKAELLAGGATSRVEVVAAPAADEWHDVVDGVVIESAPVAMGNTGRTRAAKGQAKLGTALPDRADGEQPPVSGPRFSDAVDIVPEFEPEEPRFLPPPPPTDRGGAGVRSSSRTTPPDSLTDDEIFRKTP